ncbi:MAG TPA: hypothetical protein VFN79_01245 [Steroidobacteraceae bacterium]|nr:hypothetical protein [Steroidobacteraceae bacterium]
MIKALHMKTRAGSFLQGFLRGVASPGEVFAVPQIHAPARSTDDAMRRDLEKIGSDFRCAIEHEQRDAADSAK